MTNEEPHGPAEPEPPRREFRFKPTEFEVTNRPADDSPGNAPIDVQKLYQQASAPLPKPPGVIAPSQTDNDVHAILRASLAKDDAKGLNEVIPKSRQLSRRARDYWLILASGNLIVVAIILWMGKNTMTLAFGFTAMLVITVVTTWIMWFVLEDY